MLDGLFSHCFAVQAQSNWLQLLGEQFRGLQFLTALKKQLYFQAAKAELNFNQLLFFFTGPAVGFALLRT